MSSSDGTEAAARARANEVLYRDLARAVRQASAEYDSGPVGDRGEYIASAVMSLTVTRLQALIVEHERVLRDREAQLDACRSVGRANADVADHLAVERDALAAQLDAVREALKVARGDAHAFANERDAAREALGEANEKHERELSGVMIERDRFEEQVGDLVAQAGLDCEWSNLHAHESCVAEAFATLTAQVRETRRAAFKEVSDKWSDVSWLPNASVTPWMFSRWLGERLAASSPGTGVGRPTQAGEEKP